MNDDLLWHVADRVIPAALELLPGKMTSDAARAMLLAVGLQESGFAARRQLPHGPARGFWQFEKGGGIAGVLGHPQTAPLIAPLCDLLVYPATAAACHEAVEHNDVLAACFARLLLWTDPRPMPDRADHARGWMIYKDCWRPGKPHPERWPDNYRKAWQVVRP